MKAKVKIVTPQEVQTPKPVAKAPPLKTASPEASPTLQEKETFDSVLSKLNSELNFSQPENIPTTPGIQNIYGTAIDKTPQEVAASAISKLEVQGFKVSQLNNYTGGLLYAVTKNKFTEYITFTPNLEGTGTVIITRSNSPLQT